MMSDDLTDSQTDPTDGLMMYQRISLKSSGYLT